MGRDDVGRERDQFRRLFANGGWLRGTPAVLNLQVAADGPARLLQHLQEPHDPVLKFRIIRVGGQEYSDAPHTLGLLGPYRERPSRHCTAENCDELAPLHVPPPKDHALSSLRLALCGPHVRFGSIADMCAYSITSSASAVSVAGMSKFMAFAVFRLITNG